MLLLLVSIPTSILVPPPSQLSPAGSTLVLIRLFKPAPPSEPVKESINSCSVPVLPKPIQTS